MLNKKGEGVTIITSTIRPAFINHIFQNFKRQNWSIKELIIIINKNNIPLKKYIQRAKKDQNIRIFRIDESKNLGACLNFGVSKANYNYIAKFDDDDYYSPHYIPEAMRLFNRSDADVVGKRSCFFYFPHRKMLLLRKPFVISNKRCDRLAGATIMFRKRVFQDVQFSTEVQQGSDVRFVKGCLEKGYRVFSTSPYNFAALRRANRHTHTWKITDHELLASKSAKIIRTTRLSKHINKSLTNLH